jgi:hypothetical protein
VVAISKPNQWRKSENLRRGTSRTFRKHKREYLKDKINDLETNNKNKK